MGHYYATAAHLKIKLDADKDALDKLKLIFNKEEDSDPGKLNELFRSFGTGMSSYHEEWMYSFLLPHPSGEYLCAESRSSRKFVDLSKVIEFLTLVKDLLILNDGDIVVRILYEDHLQERAVYWDATSNAFLVGMGYLHRDPYHEDFSHGFSVQEEDDRLSGFITHPWHNADHETDEELQRAVEARTKEFPTKGYDALDFIPPLNISAYGVT